MAANFIHFNAKPHFYGAVSLDMQYCDILYFDFFYKTTRFLVEGS